LFRLLLRVIISISTTTLGRRSLLLFESALELIALDASFAVLNFTLDVQDGRVEKVRVLGKGLIFVLLSEELEQIL